jgi:uncharacterized protein (DUF302 family)
MRQLLFAFAFLVVSSVSVASDDGIISQPSPYSVPETVKRLEKVLQEKGITLFAKIDHAAEAEKAKMKMRPAQLLIFGSPKGGTPIMNTAPLSAIDLPVKALIWQDAKSKVWLSYNSPSYLKERHGLSNEVIKPIDTINKVIQQALE